MSQVPRFRPDIEAFAVEQDGQRLLGVRDPAGYTSSVVLLPGTLLAIVSLFDGERSIVDIQAEIMRRHGELVRREQIERIIAALDEHAAIAELIRDAVAEWMRRREAGRRKGRTPFAESRTGSQKARAESRWERLGQGLVTLQTRRFRWQ